MNLSSKKSQNDMCTTESLPNFYDDAELTLNMTYKINCE